MALEPGRAQVAIFAAPDHTGIYVSSLVNRVVASFTVVHPPTLTVVHPLLTGEIPRQPRRRLERTTTGSSDCI